MKILIQHTDSDGRTKFIEWVATCRPKGNLSMASDVFDAATLEFQCYVVNMPVGRYMLLAKRHFADFCIENGVFDKALGYYSSVLEKTISNNTIILKYSNLAENAYQGVISCNSCSDECVWEMSSEILAGYRHLFQKEDEGEN